MGLRPHPSCRTATPLRDADRDYVLGTLRNREPRRRKDSRPCEESRYAFEVSWLLAPPWMRGIVADSPSVICDECLYLRCRAPTQNVASPSAIGSSVARDAAISWANRTTAR